MANGPRSPIGNPLGPAFPDYRHPTPSPARPSQLPAVPAPRVVGDPLPSPARPSTPHGRPPSKKQ